MRTPKSAVTSEGIDSSFQLSLRKPHQSLMARSVQRGSIPGPEDTRSTGIDYDFDTNNMYAMIDLNPDANDKKVINK